MRAHGHDAPPLGPAERALAIEAAIAVLWPLTEKYKPMLDEIRFDIARARDRLEDAAPSIDRAGSRFEESIVACEQRVLEIDAYVAAGSYRKMAIRHLQPEQIARFAGLLARHAQDSLARIDRIELLATRLCARELHEGGGGLRSRAEVVALLGLAGCIAVDEESRARALGFFDAAAQRLATLTTVDDVFESGLYLDTRAYKVSLKERRLDPDVLHAAARFTIALEKCVDGLPRSDKITQSTLAARFQEAEEQVELLFGKVLGPDSGVEGNRAPTAEDDLPRTDPLPLLRRTGVRRNALRALGIAVAIAGAVLCVVRGRTSGNLRSLPAAELARLSPLLESGSLSKGKDSVLLARIPGSRWFLMSRSERRAAASDLRNRLLQRKIGAAVVFRDDDVLAIQIEQGRVLAVE